MTSKKLFRGTCIAIVSVVGLSALGCNYTPTGRGGAYGAYGRYRTFGTDRVTEVTWQRTGDVTERTVAVATLAPKSGSAVQGTVAFVERRDGSVRVVGQLTGLPPGKHGFHVHERGDCSAADASSAGGHFVGEPTRDEPKLGQDHGYPSERDRHVGDLGNITASAQGKASFEKIDDVIALEGEHSILNRAIVVHEDADDGERTASSGERVACGVIQEAVVQRARVQKGGVLIPIDDAGNPAALGGR